MPVTRLKGHDAIIARYGSVRSFTLRILYSWLTLTILFTFTWPLLVLLTSARGVAPQDTPTGWFQIRLLAPLLTAIAAGWIWQLSPVPTTTADRGSMLALAREGRVWPQVLLFLVATPLIISGFLLARDAGGALKLVSLALAETVVLQVIVSGYLHGAFDLLLPGRSSRLATIGLYALTFGMRGALAAAAEETLPRGELVLAVAGGILAGALIGAVLVWLRARSGSLLPGILALWLLFLVLGLGDFYDD